MPPFVPPGGLLTSTCCRPSPPSSGASADELELWPNPQAAAFERAVARLVPAELTRQALEALRGLDDSARPIIDAALTAVGLLGAADSEGKRRVLLPMLRWLFEYSQENFRRQQRLNRIVFACLEELAIENATLRQRIADLQGAPGK